MRRVLLFVAFCGRCCKLNYVACRHMCGNCGRCDEELRTCDYCEILFPRRRNKYCAACMSVCPGDCSKTSDRFKLCISCATPWGYKCCSGCKRSFCVKCCGYGVASNLRYCSGYKHGIRCTKAYCSVCAAFNLEPVSDCAEGSEEPPHQFCRVCRRVEQPAVWDLRDARLTKLQRHLQRRG